MAGLPEMICHRSADGGVSVNLYTTSTADVRIAGDLSAQLRQETDYPNSGQVISSQPLARALIPSFGPAQQTFAGIVDRHLKLTPGLRHGSISRRS